MNNPNKIYSAQTCQCQESPGVFDSRTAEADGTEYRRRRYECPECKQRWTSIEIVVSNGDMRGGEMLAALKAKFQGNHLAEQVEQLRLIRDSLNVTIGSVEKAAA